MVTQSVVPYGQLAYKSGDVSRVIHEVNILSQLRDHDGVVKLHAFDVSTNTGVVITPLAYCDALYLVQEYTISRETKVRFAQFIIFAVAKLHRTGFFHGDMRLENILVYGDDNFKLCDFQNAGTVSCLGNLQERAYLQPGPYYAPEAYVGDVKMDEQDVWATGMAIFCFWCNLTPPFLAANVPVDQILTQSFNSQNHGTRLAQASEFFTNTKAYIIHSFCKFCECEGLTYSILVSNMLTFCYDRCTFESYY
jgi:serine/threonine protein kinase